MYRTIPEEDILKYFMLDAEGQIVRKVGVSRADAGDRAVRKDNAGRDIIYHKSLIYYSGAIELVLSTLQAHRPAPVVKSLKFADTVSPGEAVAPKSVPQENVSFNYAYLPYKRGCTPMYDATVRVLVPTGKDLKNHILDLPAGDLLASRAGENNWFPVVERNGKSEHDMLFISEDQARKLVPFSNSPVKGLPVSFRAAVLSSYAWCGESPLDPKVPS